MRTRNAIKFRRQAALFVGALALASLLFSVFDGSEGGKGRQAGVEAGTRQEGGPMDEPAPGQDVLSAGGSADRSVDPAAARPPVPMPEAALPLVEQMDALERLAQAGDPEAVCRLFVGTRRCRMVEQRLRRAEQMQARLERGEAPPDQRRHGRAVDRQRAGANPRPGIVV